MSKHKITSNSHEVNSFWHDRLKIVSGTLDQNKDFTFY